MKYFNLNDLLKFKSQVLKHYNDDDGSIMYMGSCEKYHYFKSKCTRKPIRIKY